MALKIDQDVLAILAHARQLPRSERARRIEQAAEDVGAGDIVANQLETCFGVPSLAVVPDQDFNFAAALCWAAIHAMREQKRRSH